MFVMPRRQQPRSEAYDVIDLGEPVMPQLVPRATRPRRTYTPNPRLYTPPEPPRAAPRRRSPRARRPRRVADPVPNSRLYRPPPPRPRVPPAQRPPSRPSRPWAPTAPTHAPLLTASYAAMQLSTTRPGTGSSMHSRAHQSNSPRRSPYRSPVGRKSPRNWQRPGHWKSPGGWESPVRCQLPPPVQKHTTPPSPPQTSAGRQSRLQTDAANELLAEFLVSIMSRRYPTALRLCRRILHDNPDNETARAFFPLLSRKMAAVSSPCPSSDTTATRDRGDVIRGDRKASCKNPTPGDEGAASPSLSSSSLSSHASSSSSSNESPRFYNKGLSVMSVSMSARQPDTAAAALAALRAPYVHPIIGP